MKLLIALLGLILVLEGLPYAAFPETMQKWLRQVLATPVAQLRLFGVTAVLFGLLLCFLAQKTRLLG